MRIDFSLISSNKYLKCGRFLISNKFDGWEAISLPIFDSTTRPLRLVSGTMLLLRLGNNLQLNPSISGYTWQRSCQSGCGSRRKTFSTKGIANNLILISQFQSSSYTFSAGILRNVTESGSLHWNWGKCGGGGRGAVGWMRPRSNTQGTDVVGSGHHICNLIRRIWRPVEFEK